MNKKIALTTVLLLLFLTAHSQIEQVGRLVFDLNPMEEKFKAVGMGENGVMLYRVVPDNESSRVELTKIDTTLKITWKVYFTIPRHLTISKVLYRNETLHYLLRGQFQTTLDFQVVSIEVNTGVVKNHTIKSGVYFTPAQFEVSKQAAVIGGYFNYRPFVLYYDFYSQKTKVLPGFFNELGDIDQVKPYDDGSVDIIVSAKNVEKKRCLWIRNYDDEGNLIKTTVLQPEKGKSLIFGHSIQLENGGQMVAGVYGRNSYNSEYSRGVFIAGINPNGEYAINYYNFAQLQNFFSYMKDKREARVKNRIERKTIRGKKIKFNYRLIVHDIIPYKNQYIMTGEAFYPVYSYPNQFSARSPTFYPAANRSASNLSSPQRMDAIFEGYRYTHAVAIGFDKSGELIWDNSFEINDVKSMDLEKYVKVKPERDRILMMYQFGGGLRSKIIKDSNVIEGKAQEPIMQSESTADAKIETTENEALDYWYKDYFFAFGIQTIRPKTGPPRKVLFLAKVRHK